MYLLSIQYKINEEEIKTVNEYVSKKNPQK